MWSASQMKGPRAIMCNNGAYMHLLSLLHPIYPWCRSTHFICATTKHVLAGVELLVKYSPGHISQGRMLLDYGFTLEKNLSEVASAFEREQTKLS